MRPRATFNQFDALGWQKLLLVRRHLVSCCLLLALLGRQHTAWAQAPAWQNQVLMEGAWVKSFTVDANGNVFIIGKFENVLVLNKLIIQTSKDNPYGTFLAKWEVASKQFSWLQLLDSSYSSSSSGATSVVVESAASVAVQGSRVYAAFGRQLICINDNGNSVAINWTQQVPALITALVVQGNQLYLAGAFFQRFEAGNIILNAIDPQFTDIFVAKYIEVGPNAKFSWVWGAGGYRDDAAMALAIHDTSVYLVGDFSSRIAFFGTTSIQNANQEYSASDGFVAKLTDTGQAAEFRWAVTAGGADYDYLRGIAVEGDKVYVAGNMFESSHFRTSGAFGHIPLSHKFLPLAVVARLTDEGSTGHIDWVSAVEGQDIIYALASRGNALYITGLTSNPGAVGGYPIRQPISSNTSFFLARLTDMDTNGKYTWAKTIETSTSGLAVSTAGPASTVYIMCLGSDGTRGGSLLASLLDDPATISDYPTNLANVSLFPNPASATTTLRLPTVPGATAATIRWYTPLGQLVRTQQVSLSFPDTTLDLPLDDLAAGSYYLRIEAGSQRTTRMLLVE